MTCHRIGRDARGVSTIEFAILSPVLLLLLLGGLEMAHTLYTKALLVGQVQKAARDLSLEGSAEAAKADAIEQRVTDQVRNVMNDAAVDITLRSYHDYSHIDRYEEFNDNKTVNGKCDNGETYVDANRNGIWDRSEGTDGRGGAKDVVWLNATVSYNRLGLGRYLPWVGDRIVIKTQTLLRNQPSDRQASTLGTCP